MQGAGTLQQTSQSGAGIPELRDALTKIEELARSLEAANRAANRCSREGCEGLKLSAPSPITAAFVRYSPR